MRLRAIFVLALLCAVPLSVQALEEEQDKADRRKDGLDQTAEETLERLFSESPSVRALFDRSYGYAVFDARQTKLMVAGGGGRGVAVERQSGERTYMRMASVGVGVGLGVQLYQVVFLFEDESAFGGFVEHGWEVSGGANAVAGEEGGNAHVGGTDVDKVTASANTAVGFSDGIAVFQFTEKGLMLQADISGTKYWPDKKLNAP